MLNTRLQTHINPHLTLEPKAITGRLYERDPIEYQFKVTLCFHMFRVVLPAGCMGVSYFKKARCQVILNEEQTDAFAL